MKFPAEILEKARTINVNHFTPRTWKVLKASSHPQGYTYNGSEVGAVRLLRHLELVDNDQDVKNMVHAMPLGIAVAELHEPGSTNRTDRRAS